MTTPKEKIQLYLQQKEAAEKREPKIITVDEHRVFQQIASFKCPKGRNACGGYDCPRKVCPCDVCIPNKKWIKVFNLDYSDWEKYCEKRDVAFDEFLKHCDRCTLFPLWLEEPTHYYDCLEARGARLALDRVRRGKTVIYTNNNGWEMPV